MDYKIKNPFSIDENFRHYIHLVFHRSPGMLPPEQMIELKRAYFAAWGSCLLVARDEVGKIAEEKGDEAGVEVFRKMIKDVSDFMLAQGLRNQ
jgi:hypothetical protein